MPAAPNRLDARFAHLRSTGKRAFVAYVCAGDPTLEATVVDIVLALEAAGVGLGGTGPAILRSAGRRRGEPARRRPCDPAAAPPRPRCWR